MTMDFLQARQNMVDCQLKPNNITDRRVLEAFATIPREWFVENQTRSRAYSDEYISCGDGRQLLPPVVLARLVQGLTLESSDKVLVVAAGTGYASLIISRIAQTVVALEENQNLRDVARHVFCELETKNIQWVKNPLQEGWAESAPYDKMIINVAVEEVPQALFDQLKPGGKLATVVKGNDGLMEATILTKNGKNWFAEPLFETHGSPYGAFKSEERFVF